MYGSTIERDHVYIYIVRKKIFMLDYFGAFFGGGGEIWTAILWFWMRGDYKKVGDYDKNNPKRLDSFYLGMD